jgi:glycosyltransferase involved in cell wall biosynthesis
MPVRNARAYLDQSIGSVLAQSFHDFELVVLDDASTDGSREIVEGWASRDPRVRLVRAPAPLGPGLCSARAVEAGRSAICARMDADDWSHPERLRREWAALAGAPAIVLVGTLWEGMDAAGRVVRPLDRWPVLWPSPFAPFPHGSIMFHRSAYDAAGGYRAGAIADDLDLFGRLRARGRLAVIPAALYRYRLHLDSTTGGAARAAFSREMSGAPPGAAARNPARRRAVTPAALYLIGAARVWAGHRPALGELLAELRLDRSPLVLAKLLVLAGWGRVSPGTLRAALAAGVRLRDRVAAGRLGSRELVEWRYASA